ncbi:neuroglian-like [Contarinia nasturtii]|uniref:neuroglian-like n=1 Tax=Contarinia nasturtii TaxID=265458 RepID=UPI0012D3745C|nr:neuroglian-like [Contarinia nasturtii]
MITTPLTEATTQSSSGISTTYEPTYPPTYEPTYRPTYRPTYVPPSSTYGPTYEPTYRPTYRPTYVPPSSTYSPTYEPTYRPTHRPTYVPPSSTYRPAYKPTNRPTTNPPNVTTIQPPPIYEPEINYFKCHDNQADISWIPRGNTENIVYYTIEHSTSFKPYVWSIFVDKTDANFHVISLSPGTTYTFRVIATDKNGKFSQSSETEMCSTKPDAPYTNPTNVYVKSASSNYLLVSWKPMAQSIHNGPGFFYRIYYRQAGLGWIRPWNQETVTDWKQDKYLLKYSSSLKWEIKVVAVNKVGESKVKPIVITI